MMDELLYKLLTTAAPSGYEEAVQSIFKVSIAQYVDIIETDILGNVIAVKKGPIGSPRLMLSAHCDEVGFLVSNIDENGFLYIQEIGGIDTDLLPGRKVDIHTEKGIVPGIIGKKAIHLNKGEEKKKIEVSDIWIDIAASSRREAMNSVQIGDFVTYAKDVVLYENHLLASPSTDNRIGVWTLVETAKLLAGKPLNCNIFYVSSCQEELGSRGAKTAADHIHPDVGIAIDVTHSTDYPTADTKLVGTINLGNGPVITMGPNINAEVCRQLKMVAGDLPVQYEAIARPTGTDANVMQLSSGGVRTGFVSIPCRYMHTPYEMVSIEDALNAALLLKKFVLHNFSCDS